MVPRCYDESIASKNLCNGYKDTCVHGHMDLKMLHISNISNEFSNFFLLGDSTLHIGPVMWWIWFQSESELSECSGASEWSGPPLRYVASERYWVSEVKICQKIVRRKVSRGCCYKIKIKIEKIIINFIRIQHFSVTFSPVILAHKCHQNLVLKYSSYHKYSSWKEIVECIIENIVLAWIHLIILAIFQSE